MSIEAMKQAVEAFEAIKKYVTDDRAMPENWDAYHEEEYYALEALRQAIEQAEKQELAVQHLWECLGRWSSYLAVNGTKANMAPPNWLLDAVKAATSQSPKREWVGLTDEKIKDMYNKAINETATVSQFVMFKTFARAIEAKLKEKNGG